MSDDTDDIDEYERQDWPEPPSPTTEQPAPRTCACGASWAWDWYAPLGGIHEYRWCAPKVDPCPSCKPSPEGEADQLLRRRMADAGFPSHLHGFRLEAGHVIRQGPTESHDAFVERTRSHPETLGIAIANTEALRSVWGYRADRGLVLRGPPGVGKTTWMAALARRLLAPPAEKWATAPGAKPLPLPGQRTLVRGRVVSVRFVDLPELMEREEIKLRGLDSQPVVDVAKTSGVLMLDEVGQDERTSTAEKRLIKRIVHYRWKWRLPTVIGTNLSRDDLVGDKAVYGPSVASRLRDALDVPLGGPDWRGR